MKILFLSLLLVGCYFGADANHCERPLLSRNKVYVYSSIGQVPVKVERCLFNDTQSAYSDISDKCLEAFKSGVFEDKWSDKNVLEEKESPVVLEEYVTKADLVKNEIFLRSGSVCRYDRGFCYDPAETLNYAIVWETVEKPNIHCPEKLHKVFEGEVDLWKFEKQNHNYLFYYDENYDKAFYLALIEKGNCQENVVWYTQEGYIISLTPLKSLSKSSNEKYFSTRSKRAVSEAILKNCDLRSVEVDELTSEINIDYLSDPYNLQLLLKKYEEFIKQSEAHLLEVISKETTSNTQLLKVKFEEELSVLRTSFEKLRTDVVKIQSILSNGGGNSGSTDLAIKITELIEKTEEYEELHSHLIQANKKINQQINSRNLDIDKLIRKLELLQTVINGHIPEFIKKSEVIDRITDLKIDFEQEIKHLAVNISNTILNLESKAKAGVKGGSSTSSARYELEKIVMEKLKSYNEDQCDAAIAGLTDKIKQALHHLRSETYGNITISNERLMDKIKVLYDKSEPLDNTINEVQTQIKNAFKLIADNDKNIQSLKTNSEKVLNEFLLRFAKLEDKDSDLEKSIKNLQDVIYIRLKQETNLGPEAQKLQTWTKDLLTLRDERLDSLELVTVALTDDVKNNTADINMLKQKIHDIIEKFSKFESIKTDILDNLKTDFLLVKNNITTIYQLLEEQSNIQAEKAKKVESEKSTEATGLKKIENILEQIKTDVASNVDRISKLEGEEIEDDDSLDAIKKEMINQETSLKTLEKLVQTHNSDCDYATKQNLEKVGNLTSKITELYDIVKYQENVILALKKQSESYVQPPVEPVQHEESNSGLHGGISTSIGGNKIGFKGGVNLDLKGIKGLGHHHGWNNWKHGNGHKGKFEESYRVESSDTMESFIVNGKHTQQSQHTEQMENIVLNELKEMVFEAKSIITDQEKRIDALEAKLDQLTYKLSQHETSTNNYLKALDKNTVTNHVELISIETELKNRISKCCGATKSSFKGFHKH